MGRSARQARRRLEEATKQAVKVHRFGRIFAVFRASIAPRKSARGMSFIFATRLFVLTIRRLCWGSKA